MNDFGPDDFDILSPEDFKSWKGLDIDLCLLDEEDDDDLREILREDEENYHFAMNRS